MTFEIRQINVQFSTANNEVTLLEGLRATAIILNPGGENTQGQLQLRIYGMTLSQMNQFSSAGSVGSGASFIADSAISITVLAGNQGGILGQVFQGGIQSSYIDFASVPEVAFVCTAQAGLYQNSAPAAPNGWDGTQNAEDLIESLASAAGLNFYNNPDDPAHAVIQNQYAYGSTMAQIKRIIKAANFGSAIENDTVYIFRNDGTRDGVVIDVSPSNGLVGYPTYYPSGFIVKTEFNPQIIVGRTINLTSQIPKANGKWVIFESIHELSTFTPDGPWFTTAKLGFPGTNNVSPT